MPREIPQSLIEALEKQQVIPFFTVLAELDGGNFAIWSGLGEVTIDNVTYTGVGTLLSISEMKEDAKTSAQGISIQLSGISQEAISLILTTPYQNRAITVGFVCRDIDTDAYLHNILFKGTMDVMGLTGSATDRSIQLTCQNKLSILNRNSVRRYTFSNQESRFPGDIGFQYIESLQSKQFDWGAQN